MAVKAVSLSLTHIVFITMRPRLTPSITLPFLLPLSSLHKTQIPISRLLRPFSTTSTPYPLQYDMIIRRPAPSSLPQPRRGTPRVSDGSDSFSESESPEKPDVELSLDGWVDHKLAAEKEVDRPRSGIGEMDKSKRKYYNKRRKRMYGSDSDDGGRNEEGAVELRPEVVEFDRLHKREEELYFYDAFAYPWEKDKHYKMVYELEKKYFPGQCLDKAFLEPGASNEDANVSIKGKVKKLAGKVAGAGGEVGDDKGLVFFEEEGEEKGKKDLSTGVVEKKVDELFTCLTKAPSEDDQTSDGEPYLLTRGTKLPSRWDSSFGTVVLVNKPKGWTSFTVCGKLRRLVKVKKVGHAGTLDPMATGLLIVCVGKATKLADTYQGMIKGYSGIFRLGEATSTWDADSPVIQREPWEHIRDEDIKKAVSSFLGQIWQVPPMFSAIKVKGERVYDKARRGESIELAPRRISIFEFDIERSIDDRQDLIFRVVCSKGTYIRSLCSDLGKALGSCAHLTALCRDSIGEYSAEDAWDFAELEEAIAKE